MDLTTDKSPSRGFTKIPLGLIIVIAILSVFSLASASAGYFLYQKLSYTERQIISEERAMSALYELEKMAETVEEDEEKLQSALEDLENIMEEDENSVFEDKAIEWTARKEIHDLRLVLKELPDYKSRYYKVGTVIKGKYDGGEAIIASVPEEGMGVYLAFYRFIRHEGKLYLLSRYSPPVGDYGYNLLDKSKFFIDAAYTIPELDIPPKVSAKDGAWFVERGGDNQFFSANGLRKIFTHEKWGDFYTDSDPYTEAKFFEDTVDPEKPSYGGNAFYFRAADGTSLRYELDISSLLYKNNAPDITWNDGIKNTTYYTYTDVGGCGSSNFASVMTSEKVNEADLIVAGSASNGDMVYEFKDSNHPFLKDFYEKRYLPIVQPPESETVNYDEFASRHPLFFWRDPFDRLIKFESNEFIPQVECAKPVIYLYPEKTKAVSVKISPKGGLTLAEPSYDDGWNVIAHPDGRLIETKTGEEYPYLFWEGRGGIYQTPKKGFVVQQKNVHAFLVGKLARLGLNDQEIKDFTEYWEPYMQSAPYYFITFLTDRMVDELAPLEVSPKPDTVIRILMDFESLAEPREVEGYEIKTPARRGFTVVEWGGVKR